MARYGRDFMGRVRGMWNQLSDGMQHGHGPQRGRDASRPPMEAEGPGGEGYFLSPSMARGARYSLDYDGGRDDVRDRGLPPGGMAQFGRAGAGRGYGGDYRTGRGGSDAGEFFVNRNGGGDTGYHGGYERDLGMRGGMAAGGRGYGADYARGGSARDYGRGYRGGQLDRGPRYARDYSGMDAGMRGDYGGAYRGGGGRTPFPRPWGR